jgi:hypothetical protein
MSFVFFLFFFVYLVTISDGLWCVRFFDLATSISINPAATTLTVRNKASSFFRQTDNHHETHCDIKQDLRKALMPSHGPRLRFHRRDARMKEIRPRRVILPPYSRPRRRLGRMIGRWWDPFSGAGPFDASKRSNADGSFS